MMKRERHDEIIEELNDTSLARELLLYEPLPDQATPLYDPPHKAPAYLLRGEKGVDVVKVSNTPRTLVPLFELSNDHSPVGGVDKAVEEYRQKETERLLTLLRTLYSDGELNARSEDLGFRQEEEKPVVVRTEGEPTREDFSEAFENVEDRDLKVEYILASPDQISLLNRVFPSALFHSDLTSDGAVKVGQIWNADVYAVDQMLDDRIYLTPSDNFFGRLVQSECKISREEIGMAIFSPLGFTAISL